MVVITFTHEVIGKYTHVLTQMLRYAKINILTH
jgi:hypothetical protein